MAERGGFEPVNIVISRHQELSPVAFKALEFQGLSAQRVGIIGIALNPILRKSATFLPLGKHEKRLIAMSLFPCKRVIVIMRFVF